MMIGKVRLNVALSRINPHTVSSRLNSRMMRKNGVTKITGGRIRCDKNQVVKLLLRGR